MGDVHALDMPGGGARTILEAPGAPPIVEVALADDGATLAAITDPGRSNRGAKRPPAVWQLWNLEAAVETPS